MFRRLSAGTVKEVRVKVGDKVSEGSPIVLLEAAAARRCGAALAAAGSSARA